MTQKLSTPRVLAWEARWAVRDLLQGHTLGLRYAREKVAEAIAQDVAWALPRSVALWAFVRVSAAATTGPWSGTHPDSVTYKMAHDRWTGREGVQAGSTP